MLWSSVAAGAASPVPATGEGCTAGSRSTEGPRRQPATTSRLIAPEPTTTTWPREPALRIAWWFVPTVSCSAQPWMATPTSAGWRATTSRPVGQRNGCVATRTRCGSSRSWSTAPRPGPLQPPGTRTSPRRTTLPRIGLRSRSCVGRPSTRITRVGPTGRQVQVPVEQPPGRGRRRSRPCTRGVGDRRNRCGRRRLTRARSCGPDVAPAWPEGRVTDLTDYRSDRVSAGEAESEESAPGRIRTYASASGGRCSIP